MEARLATATSMPALPAATAVPKAEVVVSDETPRLGDEILPVESGPTVGDDVAESAFRAEAKERGELVRPTPPPENVEEISTKPPPPLQELVQRIPADVREALDDLFRAKFIAVKRVPKNALKN